MKYSINTAWCDDEKEWLAVSPEWPSLSYFACTRHAAIWGLEEIIEKAMEMTQEEGDALPRPHFVHTHRD